MEKISTLFQRERHGGKVTDAYAQGVLQPSLDWVATEKLNGVNVRLTIREGQLVRLEVRNPPSVKQRDAGITHPWYRDALPEEDPGKDYWLWNAARNTKVDSVPDGEWSGEAVGPKIQKNSLALASHRVYLFSLIPWIDTLADDVLIPPVVSRAPMDYDGLVEWLPHQESLVNPEAPMEGLVWWFFDEPVAKIKGSDFRILD